MRITFKAILDVCSNVETKESYKIQRLHFKKPKYDQFTGEKTGETIYPAVIFNDRIEKINADQYAGEICKVVAFLDSFESKKEDNIYYNLSLNVVEILRTN